jgi:hypothetical protein
LNVNVRQVDPFLRAKAAARARLGDDPAFSDIANQELKASIVQQKPVAR